VVEAVRAGVEIQRGMAERNADAPEDQRIVFRIGINQGDVIIDGDDIYGDGVNVAARLQERATPGGICISDRVYGDIRGKIDVGFDDLGDQELKNIPEPVRVYRVLTGPDAGSGTLRKASRRKFLARAAMAAALVVAVAGGLLWQQPWAPDPTIRLSAKPSIAVLPFVNLSADAEDEYFSDGITTDIITDLSKFRDLFVIARNSVFAYKDRVVTVDEVSRDLGVRYILEGSVQKQGERVRINVQLIDSTNGQNLWAERYDEPVADVFDLQEKITRHIVRALAVKLTEIEQRRAFARPTRSLEAYDYVLRGRALIRLSARKENFKARELFRRAIELDPNYASAYAGFGWTYIYPILYGWTGSPNKELDQAEELARKALTLSVSNIDGHKLLTRVYITRLQYDLALVESERVIAINPNDPEGHIEQGNVLLWSGLTDGAILALETASHIDPGMNPDAYWYLALAYYLKQRYADAVGVLERNVRRRLDNPFDYAVLAASYAQLGRLAEATHAAETVRRLHPFFSETFGQFRNPADTARIAEGLRKVGL